MPNLLSTGVPFAGLFGPDAILSAAGVPVTSTPVTVYQSDGTTVATLYTDQNKGTTASNPVNTDAFGNLAFYTNPGLYILSFTVGGVPTTKVVMVDPWYADAAWNVVVDTSNASPLSGDLRLANAASGNINETIPTPSLGVHVKVVKTDSTTNTVTLTTPSGVIFGPGLGAGASTKVLKIQGDSVEVFADGTNYHITGDAVEPSILTQHNYQNGSPYTETSSVLVLIDSANLTITGVAGPTGAIALRACVAMSMSSLSFFGTFGFVIHGTTTQQGAVHTVGTNTVGQLYYVETVVTGLTPGQSYQYDLAWYVSGGTITLPVSNVQLIAQGF